MKLYEAQKKLSEFDEPYAEYFPHFPKATASWNESILLLVDLQVLLTMTRYLDSFVVVLFTACIHSLSVTDISRRPSDFNPFIKLDDGVIDCNIRPVKVLL